MFSRLMKKCCHLVLGNSTQTNNEVTNFNIETGLYQKDWKQPVLAGNVMKKKPSFTVGKGLEFVSTPFKITWFLKKRKKTRIVFLYNQPRDFISWFLLQTQKHTFWKLYVPLFSLKHLNTIVGNSQNI